MTNKGNWPTTFTTLEHDSFLGQIVCVADVYPIWLILFYIMSVAVELLCINVIRMTFRKLLFSYALQLAGDDHFYELGIMHTEKITGGS